jgi:hypothetical protein
MAAKAGDAGVYAAHRQSESHCPQREDDCREPEETPL